MPSTIIQALAVGLPLRADFIAERAKSWGCVSVATLAEAIALMGTFKLRVVLTKEQLPDGFARDLIPPTVAAGASLFIATDPVDASLWIPAVLHGRLIPRQNPMHPDALIETVEGILESHAGRAAGGRAATETTGTPIPFAAPHEPNAKP